MNLPLSCSAPTEKPPLSPAMLEVYKKMWLSVRIMKEAGCAGSGYELIKQFCEECVENRQDACLQCRKLHIKLDDVEKCMPRNILMEEYKFARTKAFRQSLLKKQ